LPRRLDPWFTAVIAILGLLPFLPFAVPIVAALALAAASLPLQCRLEQRMPGWAAATLVTAMWTLLAALPVVAMIALLAPVLPAIRQAALNPDAILHAAVQAPWVGNLIATHQDAVRAWIVHNQPEMLVAQHMSEIRQLGAHLLALLLHAALALAVLWAVLAARRDLGLALRATLRRVVSISLAEHVEAHVLRSTQAVILGMVGLAVWDGVLSVPLFALAGVTAWFAWSIALGMLSIVPGGTGLVLVLAAALLAAQGHVVAALAVLLLGHAITLSGDFIVKPKIIGAASHAPFLLVLLSIFGGGAVFGLVGLILGPVLVLTAQALVLDQAHAAQR
jgi:predicted PurR-regulated permease PerM